MAEYKLSSEFFSRMRRRIWMTGAPTLFLLAVLVTWIVNRAELLNAWSYVFGVLLAGSFYFLLRRTLRQQTESWSTYLLILDDVSITRTQESMPDIRIEFSEITRITESAGRWLGVEALEPKRRINIPSTVENYEQLRAALATRHEIDVLSVVRARLMQFRPFLAMAAGAGALVVLAVSTNTYIIAVIGTVLIVVMVFGTRDLLRRAQSTRAKWTTGLTTMLVTVAIAARVVFAVLGLGQARWVQLHPSISPPPTTLGAFAYDTKLGEGILFGGIASNQWSDQTWVWDGNTWREVVVGVKPSAREKVAMAYDESRGVIVLFGGRRDKEVFNDTWEWDGKAWQQIKPDHVPPARCCHALAYDSVQHKVLLYGGWNPNDNVFYSDTWEWDGTDWTRLEAPNVPPSAGHAMVNVEPDGIVVAVPATDYAYTWEWDGHSWNQIRSQPSPSRADGTSVYDPQAREVVLFGGATNGAVLNDLWIFDGKAWNLLNTISPPPARYGQSMFYDVKRHSIIIFGGAAQAGLLDDMWEIRLPRNLSGLINHTMPTPIPTKNVNPSAMLIP